MKVALIVAGMVLALLVIGIVVLGAIDIPAPSGQVEKTIPADKLPH
jgi:hypothetical protein